MHRGVHIEMANKIWDEFITNQLTWLGQAGFKIRSSSGLVLYIDPWTLPRQTEMADLILISHPHSDHFQPKAIQTIKQKDTVIVTPVRMAGNGMMGLAPGKSFQTGPFKVTGVPAYNVKKKFHPKKTTMAGVYRGSGWCEVVSCGRYGFYPGDEGFATGYRVFARRWPLWNECCRGGGSCGSDKTESSNSDALWFFIRRLRCR